MNYPSVQRMVEYLDITREQAKEIRRIMVDIQLPSGTRMRRIDKVLRTHGVEYVPAGNNTKSPAFEYCNTGDSYAGTIVKTEGRFGTFMLSSWGDIVERGNYDDSNR